MAELERGTGRFRITRLGPDGTPVTDPFDVHAGIVTVRRTQPPAEALTDLVLTPRTLPEMTFVLDSRQARRLAKAFGVPRDQRLRMWAFDAGRTTRGVLESVWDFLAGLAFSAFEDVGP